jgi:hypothetical protein
MGTAGTVPLNWQPVVTTAGGVTALQLASNKQGMHEPLHAINCVQVRLRVRAVQGGTAASAARDDVPC